jgi:hypothetical protein
VVAVDLVGCGGPYLADLLLTSLALGWSEVPVACTPHVPWRAAADMRDRVIHGYFDIDLDVVWSAAVNEVPALASAAAEILAELTSEEGH